jgi:arsenate reductase
VNDQADRSSALSPDGQTPARPLRVLVLCTRNSARSQMAEALFTSEVGDRVEAASAGSDPGPGVHPLAVAALAELGIDWRSRPARGLDAVADEPWDVVITVCDAARDACPYLPGAGVTTHWGLEDPAAAVGNQAMQLAAFRAARDRIRAAVRAFADALPPVTRSATGAADLDGVRGALAAGHRALGATGT